MAGELEERQETPAPEPRVAVVDAPIQAASNAESAEIAEPVAAENNITADAANDGFMSPAEALNKNPQFQSRSYDLDQAPQAKNDNGLSGHGEANKPRSDEIAMGSSQTNGVQMIRANLMTAHKDIKTSAIEAQQARARAEAQRIAQWNATTIMVGGVQMTNEQAQNARRDVIRNADQYADLAVKKGLIKEEDKEKFKKTAQEMYDLKETEKKRGYATPEEQKKYNDLQNSKVGIAAEKMTATAHVHATSELSLDAAYEKTYETGKAIKSELTDSRYVMAPPVAAASANQSTSIAKTVASKGVKDDIDLTSDFGTAVTGTALASQAPIPSELKVARAAGASGPT